MNTPEAAAIQNAKATRDYLGRYLSIGLKEVEGWLSTYSAEFIATLSEIQRDAGLVGSVGEIGVHHGKLFILLLLTASDTEKAFAIDVFEQQHLNTDSSGMGDRNIFLTNIRHWARTDSQLRVIARSSLHVQPDEIVAMCGKVRLVSVDGGHTEECVVNDLSLAGAILLDWGIAVVDDYFNPCWPDVSTGVAKYLLSRYSRLCPFAISPNKVYLCRPECAGFYRSEIRRYFYCDRESQMFGSAVDLYAVRPPNYHASVASILRERLTESTVGSRLLSVEAILHGGNKERSSRPKGWRYRIA